MMSHEYHMMSHDIIQVHKGGYQYGYYWIQLGYYMAAKWISHVQSMYWRSRWSSKPFNKHAYLVL